MEFPNSLHDALRSMYQMSGASGHWTRQKTKNLCKELTPLQQNLLREVAEKAATSRERACELEVTVRKLEALSMSEACENSAKHIQIQVLTEQIKLLATKGGLTQHPLVKAFPQQVVKSDPVDLVNVAMIEFMLIRDFVQSVRKDSTLLQLLQRELKAGKPCDAGELSGIKKTVAATIENWVISQKKPAGIAVQSWRKLVRDSIADPRNSKLSEYSLPNLHHFIEKQVMNVRHALMER